MITGMVFSTLTAHWNHLGSFKTDDTWAPPPEILIPLAWDTAQGFQFSFLRSIGDSQLRTTDQEA